jgi:fluoroacetyl-CoA thioesterase
MASPTLQPGLRHELRYQVPAKRTVPYLLPEAPEFITMPQVLATGYLVALLEWTCIRLIKPHIAWPGEQSVGIRIAISHEAPTPPGMTVTTMALLTRVTGRRLEFDVSAHDGLDIIARGTHERSIINTERFAVKAAAKAHGSEVN